MHTLPTKSVCAGPWNRREWLKIGALSLGTLAVGAPPSLTQLLAASAKERDFSVILFWANGGPSHIDLFDLKPDAPDDYRGPFRPIATRVPGMEVSDR